MLRYFRLLSILLSVLFQVPQVWAASIVDSLYFEDVALNECFKKQANTYQWEFVNDIKKLKCHGMNIASAKGIEVLTHLTSLSLYNNNIERLDLSSLKKLEEVNVANNKLKEIKIAGLSKLTSLYLFKNKLTHIDFSGLTYLEKIRITNNQLYSIDISPLISLEKAYFFDNKLEELIVKGLPKLTFIELRQNPMPDEVYDRYDAIEGITIVHDGNADDWK